MPPGEKHVADEREDEADDWKGHEHRVDRMIADLGGATRVTVAGLIDGRHGFLSS
jgi:hypothetical protein